MKTILAHSIEMAEGDILRHVDPEVLAQIKGNDPHPQFSAYVIGQEGESGGDLTIQGQRVRGVQKKWLESAIKSLYEKLKVGTQVFHLHAQTNEHEGRRPIGRMVGKALEVIKDKLSAIVINYIEPAARNMGLDVASMEADLRIDTDGDSVIVSGIDEVTGIALANSRFNRPGFPGATILATVQELAGGNQMTLQEVIAAVKDGKFRPSDIFNASILRDDPVVEDVVKEATKGEYAHRKRTDDAFDKARKEWEEKEKKYQDDLKSANGKALSGTVKEKAKALMESRKLGEQEISYLGDFIKDFTVDDAAKLESELNAKLDEGLKQFNHLATNIFKVKKDGKTNDGVPPANPDTENDEVKNTKAYKELSV